MVNNKIKSERGSVSVFIAIILAGILVFNMVVIDYVRVKGYKNDLLNRTRLALNSILSDYDSILAARYGLFGINLGNGYDIDTMFKYYILGNRNNMFFMNTDRILYHDFLPFSLDEIVVYPKDPLTDTDVLEEQIYELMKYKTGSNIILEFNKMISTLVNSEDVINDMEFCNKIDLLLEEASEKIDQLDKLVNGIYYNDPACINGYMSLDSTKEIYDIVISDLNSFIYNADTGPRDSFLENIRFIYIDINYYLELNNRGILLINDLDDSLSEIEIMIEEIEQNAFESGDVDYKVAESRVEEYIEKLKEKAETIKNISIKNKLLSNISKLNDKTNAVSELLYEMEYDFEEAILHKETLSHIVDVLYDQNGIYTDLNINSIEQKEGDVSYAEYDPTADVNAAINESKDLNTEDIEEISDLLFSSLPSQRKERNNPDICSSIFQGDFSFDDIKGLSQIFTGESIADLLLKGAKDIFNNILIDDYIMTYTKDRFSDSDYKCMDNETEYIISGKRSQSENNDHVWNSIFVIRLIMDIIHIMTDDVKYDLATAIGAGISAATGGFGANIYTTLIICGWGIIEALSDMDKLLEGESVPLIKESDDWHTDIEGLMGSITEGEGDFSESITDMYYRDYLRILLFITDKETKLLRMADIIELNISRETGMRYMLSGVYTSLHGDCSYEIKLYSTDLIQNKKKKHVIEVETYEKY